MCVCVLCVVVVVVVVFVLCVCVRVLISLSEVSLDIAEDRRTGHSRAYDVEQCQCPSGYRGLSCEVSRSLLLRLKDEVQRISTFQNIAHQGIQLCLGDSGKYKEKIFMLV